MNKIILFFLLFISSSVFSADLYPFHSLQKERKFNALLSQLRCLICQNESLSSSNAKIANDLRNQIYHMVQQGKSDQQIKQYLVVRYGNFILFKPPFIISTYLLWCMPFLMLLLGGFIMVKIIRKNR